jgi:hypothetical protein
MKALLSALFLLSFLSLAGASSVVVYKNEACGHCGPYLAQLKPALAGLGITDYAEKEIINNQNNRAELARLQERFGVPFTMQGHMVVNVDGKYLFEGHVPMKLITDFLRNDASKYDRMVVTQDSMDPNSPTYYLLSKDNKVAECPAEQGIAQCFESGGKVVGAVSTQVPSAGLAWWQIAFVGLIVIVPLSLIFAFGRGK